MDGQRSVEQSSFEITVKSNQFKDKYVRKASYKKSQPHASGVQLPGAPQAQPYSATSGRARHEAVCRRLLSWRRLAAAERATLLGAPRMLVARRPISARVLLLADVGLAHVVKEGAVTGSAGGWASHWACRRVAGAACTSGLVHRRSA